MTKDKNYLPHLTSMMKDKGHNGKTASVKEKVLFWAHLLFLYIQALDSRYYVSL